MLTSISERKRVAWVVGQLSTDVASTRYRCLYPALALQDVGVESRFFSRSKQLLPDLTQFDALVFVKLLDADSLQVAAAAKVLGLKVFVDLCDNVIVSSYATKQDLRPSMRLAAVSAIADCVITASPALADAVRPLLSARVHFIVVPDQIETAQSVREAALMAQEAHAAGLAASAPSRDRISRGLAFMQLLFANPPQATKVLGRKLLFATSAPRHPVARLIQFTRHTLLAPREAHSILVGKLRQDSSPAGVAQPSGAQSAEFVDPPANRKIVLWFGNYGAPHSDFGMLGLLQTAKALEAVAQSVELELVVISNNEAMFNASIKRIGVPTRYIEWSTNAVFEALRHADVCLVPFGRDPFSVTKSANRAVMALHHGVPVVTSRLASMEPLGDAVAFDDWETGLRHFLGPDAEKNRREAVAKARDVLDRLYAPEAIGRAWNEILTGPSRKQRFGYTTDKRVEIGVLLNLSQDLDLLLPVLDALITRQDVFLRVLLAPGLVESSNRVLRALIDREIVPFVLERQAVLMGEDRILRNLDVLLTASETSLNPHKLAHQLTKSARGLGVATYTLQHGLENVGLTFFDGLQGADVTFAAEHVLTWAEPDKLPATLRPETRAKCVAVGRASRIEAVAAPPPPGLAGRRIVSVFENLHWHRYPENYRESFIADLLAFCEARPDLAVLLKPHHAGRYLIKNRSRIEPAPRNLLVADPTDAAWEPYTAPALIPMSFAVLTTPSTVALDAAELDCPAAVAGYGLDLPVYEGLPRLDGLSDWLAFVASIETRPQDALALARAYRDRVRMPGDAVSRIVNLLVGVPVAQSSIIPIERRAIG